MLDYLIERENEEMFRTSARDLTFPDGVTRRIDTYRLVWTWYDRAQAYKHGHGEERILTMALQLAEEKSLPIDVALGELLNFLVKDAEEMGMDYTDNTLELTIAKQAIERFSERKHQRQGYNRIDFARINQAAVAHIDTLLFRWLPDGKRIGAEWVARNPIRADRKPGSFKVNLQTGRWGDFSSGDYGGDLVSLGAYLHTSGNQRAAALEMAEMLGMDAYE